MSTYDPAFWEISVDPEILESVLIAPDMLEHLLITPEEERAVQEEAQQKEAFKQEAVDLIRELIHTQLTPRQRQVIEMYFYQNMTQQEIADALGVSQQVVSKTLFGVVRDGRKVGGAVKKLRKLCEKQGIDPQKWV
jgi:RNA polymerase sigma factor (sigma-70 family)